MKIVTIIALIALNAHAQQPLQFNHAPKAVARAYYEAGAQASSDKTDTITLERTACFGTCPIYKVTITSDGSVSFQGVRFTKTQSATGKISRRAFRRLAREFEKIKYFSLPDDFTPGTKNCPNVMTDMPSANTAIHLKGKSKTVSHYYGCGNSGVLPNLTALETKIDQVAGTRKWIK